MVSHKKKIRNVTLKCHGEVGPDRAGPSFPKFGKLQMLENMLNVLAVLFCISCITPEQIGLFTFHNCHVADEGRDQRGKDYMFEGRGSTSVYKYFKDI